MGGEDEKDTTHALLSWSNQKDRIMIRESKLVPFEMEEAAVPHAQPAKSQLQGSINPTPPSGGRDPGTTVESIVNHLRGKIVFLTKS